MAIKSPSQRLIRSYWPRYKSRAVLVIVISQLVLGLAIYSILVVLQIVAVDHGSLAIGSGILLASVTLTVVTTKILLRPLRQITNAISYVAGEQSSMPANQPKRSSPLYPILEVVYNSELIHTTETTPAPIATLTQTEAALPVAVARLNTDGVVIDGNHLVPKQVSTDNITTLKLLFESDEKLTDWIQTCEMKAIKAQRSWQRVPSHPVGDPDRKIYDIVASYDKSSNPPVTVVLIDKTEDHKPEDEELNFIAFAAHELRGPITVINGYVDTLNDELANKIDSEQQQLFDRLTVSANRLSGYINNILNVSKYDRRHLNMHLAEVRPIDIYGTIEHDMALRASSQNRLLSVNLPSSLPTVAADLSSITEVFANLIDNAIKYSFEGGAISVTAEQHDNWVEIEVTDHGIGMPQNVVKNLFHKFYRSHRSRETVAGTGIGLYISKAIVESHGGTMNVRSIEGEGSTFSFTLPTYASVAEKLMQDNGSNRTLIKHGGGWIKNHGTIRG